MWEWIKPHLQAVWEAIAPPIIIWVGNGLGDLVKSSGSVVAEVVVGIAKRIVELFPGL